MQYIDSQKKNQSQVIASQLIRRNLSFWKKDYFILFLPTFGPGFQNRFHYWILNLS